MSEQKEKYFQRQHSRFARGAPRKDVYQSADVKNSANQSEPKEETVTQSFAIKPTESITQEKTAFSLAVSAQDNLKRLIACPKTDFESLIRDKILRQDLKKQQRRLTKARNDNKLTVQTDTELSITAINGIISLAEEYINDVNKQKAQKIAPKSTLRANQQKEIARQLKTIDQQIQLNNFASVKSTIQILLKKYGKDELLQEKVSYLNFILSLNEEYERQAGLLKDLSLYVEKLSSVDITPENINQSSLTLKNLKKQTTIALNKENKKQQPNEKAVALITQVDKIGGLLSSYIDSKTQKKIGQLKTKRQIQLEKQIQQRMKSSQFLEESSRFCRDLLQKTSESKEELFKELETLKKNKKKSTEVPYSVILRIYENIALQKREINQINLYFKACSQFYLRKNLNADNLALQIKKLDEKYTSNQTLGVIKPNLEVLINNVQQRERLSKQVLAVELQLKKIKADNIRLEKLLSQSKTVELPGEIEKTDKRKQLQQRRVRQAQKLKQQKEQKEIERGLDNIFNSLQQKKWKVAKNSINVFTKRYQESSSSLASKSLQSLNTISNIVQELEGAETRLAEIEKRQKGNITTYQKQKQVLSQKLKSSQEYELAIRNLIQNFNQQGFVTKKYFDDLRRDRKKIVQQRYQLIMKLQEPITAYRQAKLPEVSQKVSLSLSSLSIDNQLQKIKKDRQQLAENLEKEKQKSSLLESRLKQSSKAPQINKDAVQLLNLAKRIQKGGEWWKFLPKNLKNSTFKHIYSILEKYRQNQLTIQSLQMFMVNQEVMKEEANTLSNALDSALSSIQSGNEWLAEQFWNKNLANYKGNKNCDKIISCLNQISGKARSKVNEQRLNYKNEVSSYEQQIQNLSNAINDLEKRKDSQTQKSSSKLEESSAKKSPELKSSRRTSRSKDKDRDGQVKEAMQEFVQQQRKMLSKIQQLQGDKQNLQAKAAAIQNQLIQAERNLENQKIDSENSRFTAERIRLQQLERINQLEGQLQISEGRRIELQGKLQAEIVSFRQLERELTSKLHYFQTREAEHQLQFKPKENELSSEAQLRITSQLNYYREMYGELSKQLQISKEKEQQILKDFESLRRNTQILEKKYHAEVSIHQSPPKKSTEQNQSIFGEQSSPLRMKPYKIDLNSEKIFDIYLDSERAKPRERIKKEVNVETPSSQPSSEPNIHEVAQLRLIIENLQGQLRNLQLKKSQEIEREVITALKVQQSDFNEFLKRFEAEKFQFFMHDILPKRLEEELAIRKEANSSNYEFMHNEWIINEFPRLYEQRHSRQCPNANIDIEVIVNRRLQAAREDIEKEKMESWDKQTNIRIEQSLIQFQQHSIPLIIEQHRLQWQEIKAKEWEIKVWQIEQYWQRVLEEQRSQLSAARVESPLKKTIQIQPTIVNEEIYRQPTELELLEIMRRESSKHILDALLGQQFSDWEQNKANEWIIERNKIEAYFENIVIPAKQIQWQHQKEKEISQLKQVWLSQNDQQWNFKLNQVINSHKPVVQVQRQPPAAVLNQEQIIERWKLTNLIAIIEGERRFAIEQFIQIDLPHILEQERVTWQSLQQAPDVNLVLMEQRKRWEQEKNKQIGLISSNFDSKIIEILKIEHVQWEKNKIIEFQKLLIDEQAHWNTNIEEILQKQRQHWELVKLQQIRSLQLEFETRLNEIQRKLNSQIIEYQEKFLKEQNRMAEVEAAAISRWKNNELPIILARQRETCINEFKSRELPKILEQKQKDWETVDLIQLIHSERNRYIIDSILSQGAKEWEQVSLRQRAAYDLKISELQQFYEKELIKQREQHEGLKKNIKQEDFVECQKLKNIELQGRIKEVEKYWETVILPERQDIWRKEQVVVVEELLSSKISEVEAAYQENFIPKIIDQQWKKWQGEYKQRLDKEREQWLAELPNILKTGKYNQYLQTYLDAQASQYELQIKKIQAQSVNSSIRIEQMTNQIAQYQAKLRENRSKYELAESKVKSLLTEHDATFKRNIEESQRLNEELTRSRWAEKEVEELRKIIEMQKGEVSKLTIALRDGQRFKLQNINLQEANSNLQKAKWQQINDLRSSYESKIIEFVSQRNNLQAKISQLEVGRRDGSDKEAIQSLERQISTLTSTLKTKDAEIAFLKKTVETVNTQLRDNRQKLNEQLEKRGSSERLLAEMRSGRLELDYQIKYLKDREESLTKKLELKDQEMLSLRKKIDLDSESIEKKLKSSLEYASSYQLKFTELESLLTYKTKQSQALLADVDRLRYENQTLTANCHSLTTDAEQLRRQVRQLETQKTTLVLERDRNIDESSRLRQTLTYQQEQLKRSNEAASRLTAQISSQKLRFQTQIKRSREEIIHLEIQVKDAERIKRIEMERAAKLQRELAEGGREAELGQIQVLKKINRDVSDLTAANRQLEMKCLLLENRQKITSSASETINSFLLNQKYTDQLLDHLLKEGVVPNLQIYHKFLAESRTALAAGRGQEYFELWERLLRDLFQLTISCRSEEIRTQAEQLLRLRDEMTDVLERQIEVSEGDQNQLVEDYKQVLNDIKSLVREYMRSGDDEYLRLLCSSLGIAL